ncbi:MAG: IclR family transcriptional regulator [Thermomicrobiales bacterium]|nr:IclR family transcriptional regulator [Thermomicrobiales bacterium]
MATESKAERTDERTTVRSVDKALAIVEALIREERPLAARDIAARVGINRTTTHRLLNALMQRGWAEKIAGTAEYRLGLRFRALVRAGDRGDLFSEVRPEMERLARETREAVHLGVLDGWEIVHVDKIDSPQVVSVSTRVGTRATPHLTGLGKAILAVSSEATADEYARHVWPRDVAARTAFHDELRHTRERGYSIDEEEASPGVRCLGVAVTGAGGEPLFAMSVTGPAGRFTPEQLAICAPSVVAVAHELSRRFGGGETRDGPVDGSGPE